MPRYPHITVKLSGQDGNAFGIAGRVLDALVANGVPRPEREAFASAAYSGDYNRLLRTCMEGRMRW